MCEVGKGKERGNEPRGSKGPSLNEGSKADLPPCSELVSWEYYGTYRRCQRR